MQVLLVEDHGDNRELLARWLIRRGYDVVTAEDLRTGIDCLDKHQFDVIISDIFLPDGTGYALISEVRRRGIRALGVAVSAHPYPSDVYERGVSGFQHFLTKPVNLDHICSILEGEHLRAPRRVPERQIMLGSSSSNQQRSQKSNRRDHSDHSDNLSQ
jgi:CheY-like chemotaxis protein